MKYTALTEGHLRHCLVLTLVHTSVISDDVDTAEFAFWQRVNLCIKVKGYNMQR